MTEQTLSPTPSALTRLRRAFRATVRRIGQMQSALLLSLFYLVCWVPVGLASRLRADWLRRRAPRDSNWCVRAPRLNDVSHLKELF